MEKTKTVFEFISFSVRSRPWRNVYSRHILSVRFYSDDSKKLQKKEPAAVPKIRDIFSYPPGVKIWNEYAAVRRAKKKPSITKRADNAVDFINSLQLTKKFPITLPEWGYYFKRRAVTKQLLEQKFLPERHACLKPDLAAAHFLTRRGGSVRFLGKTEWVGKYRSSTSLPITFVPGFYIEEINAEGTNLYYEGLSNLSSLRYLKSLSLKGIKQINDWCLDWISKEYCKTLQHLDISDCKEVTYKGLSCFYRFEQLKTLDVQGISDSPEFKLACIMLQDVIPELEIKGIDLSIPKKIESIEEVKNIPAS